MVRSRSRILSLRSVLSFAVILSAASLGSTAFADARSAAGGAAGGAPGSEHARAGHRHGGEGGVNDLLRAAESLPDLTSTQKDQLTKLKETARSAKPAMAAAHEALAAAVATQVDANKIDRAALASQVKAVSDAEAAEHAAHRTALDGLHTLLTPAQRTELANGIETKISAKEAKHAAREAQKAATGNAHANAKTSHEGAGPWGHALGLSPAQAQQIRASLQTNAPVTRPSMTDRATHAKSILDNFKADSFSASSVTPLAGGRQPGRMIDYAQAAVPVLTDAQRTELANLLRGETN